MSRPVRRGWLAGALVVAVGLLVGSVVWVAANDGLPGAGRSGARGAAAWGQVHAGASAVPDLPGTVVHVTLSNMGGGMMGRRAAIGGAMWLRTDASTVPAGTVSFVAANVGSDEHELVVLSLAPGQDAGARAVRADGTVAETGSLGEASRSDGAGAGDGIEPGTSGWVTVELAPGRYEVVCNIAGHYAAGMYAELTVS